MRWERGLVLVVLVVLVLVVLVARRVCGVGGGCFVLVLEVV